jgi:hypothetical protein
MNEFMECRECSNKPGTPILCDSCLNNRDVIDLLNKKLTPRLWSIGMDRVWHQSLPDMNKAFERIRELDI